MTYTTPTSKTTTRGETAIVFFRMASDSFGGGSKMLYRLLSDLDTERFDITVLSQCEDELSRRVRSEGIRVEIIPYRGVLDTYDEGLFDLSPPMKIAAVARLIQFNIEARETLTNADVVWCDCLRSVLTITPYILNPRTPAIWNIGLGHGSDGTRKYLNDFALMIANHVFIESESQAERVFTTNQYKQHKDKFTVFHKGIDTSTFAPRQTSSQSNTEFKVGTAASLTPRKGLEYLIDAAARVLKHHDDVSFHIAGETTNDADEEYVEALQQQVREHGIEDSVEFHGWVNDMPTYLGELDVFVLPSLNEGIPGAVREALAMERAVIATDVGGTDEAVINGETGLLVPPEDPDALADALRRLLDDTDKRERLGQNGRDHIVEEFSVDSYIENYETFLTDLAGGNA